MLNNSDRRYKGTQKDQGQKDHGEKDHGQMDHGEMDHGEMDHGQMDHGEMDHGQMDHGEMDHGQMDHGQMDHGQMDHDQMDYGQMDYDQIDQDQMNQNQMEYGQMDHGIDMRMEYGLFNKDKDLINDIISAIILEVQAYNYYNKLLEFITNEQDWYTILRIQRDETKHYNWFTMILNMLGINIPQIPAGKLPTGLTQGIKKAIQNEIDAQEFYQDISYEATTHPIQMHFMHAAHDEQRHASLLQNMLLTNNI
jgi:rubrerythrin